MHFDYTEMFEPPAHQPNRPDHKLFFETVTWDIVLDILNPHLRSVNYQRSAVMSNWRKNACSTCHPSFKVLKSLRSLDLIKRLRSNRQSIGLERDELTQLMDDGEKELMEYTNSIDKLQAMIVWLSNERDDLKRQMHRAKSLLAPIRKLPAEILGQIFQHNAELDLTCRGENASPLSVASVSTYWRETAVTNFSLWNRITLAVFQNPFYHQCAPVVQKVIERCRNSSLFVTLRFDDAAFMNPETLNPAFALLCTQAPRWQTLSLMFGRADLESIALIDAVGTMKGKLISIQRFESDYFDDLQATLLEDAKKLTSLRAGRLLPSHQISWDKITHLQVGRSRDIEIAEMLTRLGNLRCLEVRCEGDEDDDGPLWFQAPRDDSPKPQVRSSLHSLSILCSCGGVSGAKAANLLDRLILPNLKTFAIEPAEGEHYPNTERIVDRLESFFSRSSPALTILKVHDTMLRTERLLFLLERLPTLKTLSFSEPTFATRHPLKDEFFLRLRGLQDSPPLSPQLESLQLQVNDIGFEPQLLVYMVQSRWMPDPEAQHDVACLREFTIKVRDRRLPVSVVVSMRMLGRMGLVVTAEDAEGDILSREY